MKAPRLTLVLLAVLSLVFATACASFFGIPPDLPRFIRGEKPAAEPTAEPEPTAVPVLFPREEPTPLPSPVPTEAPTVAPEPTAAPTPTPEPTSEPPEEPTAMPEPASGSNSVSEPERGDDKDEPEEEPAPGLRPTPTPGPAPNPEITEEGDWPPPTSGLLDEPPMGNQIVTQLRPDLEEIKNSGNYYTRFKAAQYAEGAEGNEYTSASFVLNITPCEQGDFWLICNRINVGLLTTNDEVRWFVYSRSFKESHQTIECLRGTRMWENNGDVGCLGDAGNIVSLNTWHGVRYVKQSNGDWEVSIEDENGKSYLVARVKPGGPELAQVEIIYQKTSPKNIVGGFWHEMPSFLGPYPYIKEGKESQMWMWPASDPVDDPQRQNRVFVNEDEFFKTCDPGAGEDYRPDTEYIQHGIKDEIEPGEPSQWYTGKIFGDPGEFVCATVLW